MYPHVWDTNSFDPVTTEGFMPEMGVMPQIKGKSTALITRRTLDKRWSR